ncbi:MAG TPA: CapA family protein [Tenuifilaceae bacterium]|nr:CapA family protein [Bacteroidales bacterium]MDI9515980.1 CapA family protein [Bacteroidota bacterium]NLH57482.1 CapA family protein [Rikenellaceae bacterium]OQC64202.1 MAG: Capsule biosynthesis protein CapA [Bacteroidetes bacterium ADurb.Bin008]HNV80790.1 CapA family protein [Tenuifilaceae bacterium]
MFRIWIAAILITLCHFAVKAQLEDSAKKQSLTLMFVGDVMGHGMQIKGAYNEETDTYQYDDVFSRVSSVFHLADITIANLEVTLAGPPYAGYPQFSSPDELVDGLTNAGVDMLVTANNHTIDRGKEGIIRTINVLRDKSIPFAGTYMDVLDRDTSYPLIIERNGIRLALLNYTYGTNGIPVPHPTFVNLIDTAQIRTDYNNALLHNVDDVIAFMHWGVEYDRSPNLEQLMLTRFLHDLGIRLVIGSHPHVLQRMEASFDTDTTEGRVVVFSLGNFVSNQRPRYRNGGSIVAINIEKENGITRITDAGYILVWIHTPTIDGKQRFRVVPVSQYEKKEEFFSQEDRELFDEFASDSRELLNSENYNFPEIVYRGGKWLIPWKIRETLNLFPIQRVEPWKTIHSYPKDLRLGV